MNNRVFAIITDNCDNQDAEARLFWTKEKMLKVLKNEYFNRHLNYILKAGIGNPEEVTASITREWNRFLENVERFNYDCTDYYGGYISAEIIEIEK